MNSGLRHPPPNDLTILLDATPGRWIEDALGSRFALVESLVPKGYAAYAHLYSMNYAAMEEVTEEAAEK